MSLEWENKFQYSEKERQTLQITINTLRITITETQTKLDSCAEHSGCLQTDLSACQLNLGTCNTDLEEIEKKYNNNEAIIVTLHGDIEILENGNRHCKGEISDLRCDISELLVQIKASEAVAYEALLKAKKSYEENTNLLTTFMQSKNIECERGPCVAIEAHAVAAL